MSMLRRGRRRRFALVLWMLLCMTALGLAACQSTPRLPDGEPFMRGTVVSIMHRATASGILVQGLSRAEKPCDLQATADVETRYLRRRPDGGVEPADRAELAEGDTVAVYLDGPVMESCPLQGRAAAIVLGS